MAKRVHTLNRYRHGDGEDISPHFHTPREQCGLFSFHDGMKARLIFPPYVSPSCVPIGIASLKAWIEQETTGIRVDLLDLNIFFARSMLKGGVEALYELCSANAVDCKHIRGCPFRQGLFKERADIFGKALTIMKDRRLFLDREVFERYAGECCYYFKILGHCLGRRILRSYVEGRLRKTARLREMFAEYTGRILRGSPDALGFSLLTDDQIPFALALSRMIKAERRIPIVLGGPALYHHNPEEFLSAFPYIDFVIRKEGERGIVQLLDHIGSKNYSDVPNLVWRKGKEVAINASQCVADLDSLPTPNFDGLPMKDYFFPKPILPIGSSRGCPWGRCKFCQLNAQYDGKYRERSVSKVIADIKTLGKKYGARHFFFTDSEISAARLDRISRALLVAKSNIFFGCYTRPTERMTKERLSVVRRAGGRFFQLGVESLSDRYLRFVDKGTTRASIFSTLAATHELGIKNLVYMLACIPSQTKKELHKDMAEISFLQEKLDIFSVIYCLYGMGGEQIFRRNAGKHGIVVRSRQKAFSLTSGKQVRREDWPVFSYRDRGAYDILIEKRNIGVGRLNSHVKANRLMWILCHEYGINEGRADFIRVINDFLFETQLLYAADKPPAADSAPARRRAIEYYRKKKSAIMSYPEK